MIGEIKLFDIAGNSWFSNVIFFFLLFCIKFLCWSFKTLDLNLALCSKYFYFKFTYSFFFYFWFIWFKKYIVGAGLVGVIDSIKIVFQIAFCENPFYLVIQLHFRFYHNFILKAFCDGLNQIVLNINTIALVNSYFGEIQSNRHSDIQTFCIRHPSTKNLLNDFFLFDKI